jgi:hypothetical protein
MKNVRKLVKISLLTMLVCCMVLVNQRVASAASGPQVDHGISFTSPMENVLVGDIVDFSFYLVNYNVPGSTPLLNAKLSFYFLDGMNYVADSIVIKKNGVIMHPELETSTSYLIFGIGDVNPGDIVQATFSSKAVSAGQAKVKYHIGFDNDLVRGFNPSMLEDEANILVL